MRATWKIVLLVVSVSLSACSNSGGSSSSTDGNSDGSDAFGESDGGATGGSTGSEGVGTTGGGTDILGAAAIPEIQGLWATRCLARGTIFAEETIYKLQSLSVVGSRMRHESGSFSDQDCTTPIDLGLPTSGTTVQQNATTVTLNNTRTTTLGDAIEVDFHFEDATIDNKPIAEDDFDSQGHYVARTEYNIVYVSEGVLYLGDTALTGYDGSSAATRPISLDTLMQFLFVPK